MKEFIEFPKMSRLSRRAIITEKIDGTNAQITITEDGEFFTGSRTRWVTPSNDNFGFSKWAHEHKEELLGLGVGTHFGEWCGLGIQRGYNFKEKKFLLFNVLRWCLSGETPLPIPNNDPRLSEMKLQEVLPSCVGLVPKLFDSDFELCVASIPSILEELKVNGSKASPGFMKPEGIVLYHIKGQVGFKKTIDKDFEPKSLNK